jgi:hypothetical protein
MTKNHPGGSPRPYFEGVFRNDHSVTPNNILLLIISFGGFGYTFHSPVPNLADIVGLGSCNPLQLG